MNTNYHILKPFIARCERQTTLPIIEYGKVENNQLTYTDLDVFVTVPVNLPDGLYQHAGGEFFCRDENPDDFPRLPETNKKILRKIELRPDTPISPENFVKLQKIVSKDSLRPIMTGICFDNINMVATDAHVLRYFPFPNPLPEETPEVLTPLPQVLLTAMRKYKNNTVILNKYKESQYLEYIFPDGMTIYLCKYDGIFPNYLSVIPKQRGEYNLSFNTETAKTLIDFTKSINKNLPAITFNKYNDEYRPIATNIDENLEKVFDNIKEAELLPDRPADGLLMPVLAPNADEKADFTFALNATLLQNIITGHKGNIYISVDQANQPILFWLEPAKTVTRKAVRTKPASKIKTKTTPVPQPETKQKPAPETKAKQPAAYNKKVIWSNYRAA